MSRLLVQQTFADALSLDNDTLKAVEEELRPMYAALPKGASGSLEPAVVRYALHRYFVQKHGWHLKGLAPGGQQGNASSPASVLKDQIPEYVQSLQEQHVHGQGWHLHELAICAAALSALIQREVVQDLDFVYGMLNMSNSSVVSESQLEGVIALYLGQYIVDPGFTEMTPTAIMSEITDTYGRWDELLKWALEVKQNVVLMKDSPGEAPAAEVPGYSFGQVSKIVEEVMDQYSNFQGVECGRMTEIMLGMEHQSTGRIPLAKFYTAGVMNAWEFWEPKEYLQHAGALDESDPKRPSVIIPNYVYGMNNCLASSSFFAVCCTNKCEQLVGHLERELQAPRAAPQRLAALVAELPSATVEAPRTLPASLLTRLDEIAAHHGGEVPLHGRLFSQWLHHAYPRECPFPLVDAEQRPLTPEAWAAKHGTDFALDVAEMEVHIRQHRHGARDHSEGLPWAADEELVGHHLLRQPLLQAWWQKGLAAVALASFALPLLRSALVAMSEPSTGKVHVI